LHFALSAILATQIPIKTEINYSNSLELYFDIHVMLRFKIYLKTLV